MHRRALALVDVLSILFSPTMAADNLPKKYPVLAALRMPASQLPTDCREAEISASEKALAGLKNLAITTDPKFFFIADERLDKLLDAKAVEATYFGLYYQDGKRKWDLGIIGWACSDEAAAQKHHDAMAESYKNEPDSIA